jgi:hypothetical protein
VVSFTSLTTKVSPQKLVNFDWKNYTRNEWKRCKITLEKSIWKVFIFSGWFQC